MGLGYEYKERSPVSIDIGECRAIASKKNYNVRMQVADIPTIVILNGAPRHEESSGFQGDLPDESARNSMSQAPQGDNLM